MGRYEKIIMIYFITGDNREKVQKISHDLVVVLQKKRPNALLFRMSQDEWDENSFEGLVTGQGLFENKYIVVLDSIFRNEEGAEYIESNMKDLATADHVFVFIEYSPTAPVKNLIKKHAEKVWDASEKYKIPKKEFNVFSLTDALGERNRLRLWILYQKALIAGSEPEEIHGILFWQIKSLLATAQSKTAEDAGLKPFVWGKSKGFLKNYSLPELKKISSDMVNLYHMSRINGESLEISLERWVVGVK